MLHTNESPAAVMSNWLLTGEPAHGFTVDRECELKGQDEMKSVVRYARHSLDIDEVRQHIQQGKMPTRLAMTFHGRMSFTLTDALQLRKVEFLDGVIDTAADMAGHDRFYANATIFAAEVHNMLVELVDALGGEHEHHRRKEGRLRLHRESHPEHMRQLRALQI
jgi:recombination associated protein RdgC